MHPFLLQLFHLTTLFNSEQFLSLNQSYLPLLHLPSLVTYFKIYDNSQNTPHLYIIDNFVDDFAMQKEKKQFKMISQLAQHKVEQLNLNVEMWAYRLLHSTSVEILFLSVFLHSVCARTIIGLKAPHN